MESEEDEISVHLREHYEKHMCTHPACAVPDVLILAQSFGNMSEDDRINTIRCMMLALTSPTGMKNAILNNSRTPAQKHMRRHQNENYHCVTAYSLRGKPECRDAFAAITQVCEQTLSIHSSSVSSAKEFAPYLTRRCESRKDKLPPIMHVLLVF